MKIINFLTNLKTTLCSINHSIILINGSFQISWLTLIEIWLLFTKKLTCIIYIPYLTGRLNFIMKRNTAGQVLFHSPLEKLLLLDQVPANCEVGLSILIICPFTLC